MRIPAFPGGFLLATAWLLSFALSAVGEEPRAVDLGPPADFSGWLAVPATNAAGQPIWSVRPGGIVRCLGTPKGYLRTLASFRDYRLHVEWRWVGKPGNSGVFVNGYGPDKATWPHCYEAQLLHGNAGELRANGGAKFHADSTPKDKSLPKWHPSNERPAGEWNSYDILCRGDTIELTVNGLLQNRLEHAASTSGWIALQSEGGVVEFRHLTLTRLD